MPREGALVREQAGDDGVWSIGDYLLASTVDALRDANWQRSGGTDADRPDRVTRPGMLRPEPVPEKPVRLSTEIRALMAEIDAAAERGERREIVREMDADTSGG